MRAGGARILYLAHNLGDAAVQRRVSMLRGGNSEVSLVGFSRGSATPADLAIQPALLLGKTHDADLAHRSVMVLRRLGAPGELSRSACEANVILARNLEMLVLAARIRQPNQRLVYECLDIHRSMLGR